MSNSLRLPRKMHFMSENEHGTCTRALSRKRERRGPHFMRACAVEMDMRNSKSNFCASRPTQNAAATRANPDLNPLNSYRKNPLVRSTIWGKTKNERDPGEERLDRRHRSELFVSLVFGHFWADQPKLKKTKTNKKFRPMDRYPGEAGQET